MKRGPPHGRARHVLPLLLVLLSGCFSTMRSPARLDAGALARWEDADWAEVLARHVDGEGRVDYVALRARRAPLDRFVARLAVMGPETRPELFPGRDDQLAWALNAYNALVVFQVVERWPLGSVEDEKLSFFYFTRFPLDGDETNLHDLENERIRAGFGDPRVHFALNCASAGCPRLPAVPFRAGTLQDQLSREEAHFLHEPRNVSVEGGALVLSELFDWYAEDFPPDPRAWVLARRPDVQLPPDAPVRTRPWDWRLNAQPEATGAP